MAQQRLPWALRAVPYSRTTFEGEDVVVTIGLMLSVKVTGMVADADCDRVWPAFWDALGLGDELDLELEAVIREHLSAVEAGLGEARAKAQAMLTARFEDCR